MKASVIIPAYNAALFLEKAILSITATPPPFPYEILVIDDGSTDGTLSLLKSLSEKIPELVWFRQENAGPAAARNLGIGKARGEYVLFCDSDDTFAPRALERAVEAMEKEKGDVLIFGYSVVQDAEKSSYFYPPCRLEQNGDWKEHLAPLYRANMLNQVWGKVFSARLLKENGLLFPHEMWGEDRLFFFSVLEKADTVSVTDLCLYDYVQQKNSLISRFIPNKGQVCGKIHRAVTALAASKGPLSREEEEIFSYMYAKSLLSVLATLYSPSCKLKHGEKRRFVKELLSASEMDFILPAPPSAGKSFGILCGILRGRNVTLNLLAAWGVKTVSRVMPRLFRRSKHAYNK